jgi:hippurate hydrolase
MVFGLHNMPGITEQTFTICEGPMMAAFAHYECEITGKGGHSSTPHLNIDPIRIGTEIVQAWQRIITEDIPAYETAVIATTEFHAGTAFNICPETATLRGSCRSLSNEVAALIEKRMTVIAEQICSNYGARCRMNYHQAYPVLVNHAIGAEIAATAAAMVVGEENISRNQSPIMASEDFAEMLLVVPGAYIFLGNGLESRGGCMVHNPGYDFNDANLSTGAQYWVTLAHNYLSNQ